MSGSNADGASTPKFTGGMVTPEQLLRIPDNCTMELVGGRIVERIVNIESSETEGLFLCRFAVYLQRRPVAKLYPHSLGYCCFKDSPDTIRKAALTVIRSERVRLLPDRDSDFMPIVPDLAIEVISPNDVVYEIDAKVQEYLAVGFPLVWVADRMARTVMVHPLGGRSAVYSGDDELTAEAVLPGFRCKVSDFFPKPL